ncbi:lysis protein [Alloalcanivorax xenomutans]
MNGGWLRLVVILAWVACLASVFWVGHRVGWADRDQDFTRYKETAGALLVAEQARNLDQAEQFNRRIAEIDRVRTEEIANARTEIERLRDDVAAGRRRLRLAAHCPRVPQADGTASATSVDDGTTPELTGAAERNYWRLRERIETVTAQVLGLQDYISAHCGTVSRGQQP